MSDLTFFCTTVGYFDSVVIDYSGERAAFLKMLIYQSEESSAYVTTLVVTDMLKGGLNGLCFWI